MAEGKAKKPNKRKEKKAFLCGECGAELEYGKNTCPTCQAKVDWTYLMGHVHR